MAVPGVVAAPAYAVRLRLFVPAAERPQVPEPLPTDDRKAVLGGLVVWVIALVVCLLDGDRLRAGGDGWWLWVCVAGLALGVVGLAHLHRQELRRR